MGHIHSVLSRRLDMSDRQFLLPALLNFLLWLYFSLINCTGPSPTQFICQFAGVCPHQRARSEKAGALSIAVCLGPRCVSWPRAVAGRVARGN